MVFNSKSIKYQVSSIKNIKLWALILTVVCGLWTMVCYSGNEDRVGEAGAYELLINPWARSSGWGNANTGCVHGLEAVFGNIAGTAFTQHTEVIFAHTLYLDGSGINVNAFGLSQKVGATGVFSLAIMSMNFGDIPTTTTLNPDGGIGTFSPKYMNINLAYAKSFLK